MDDEVVGKVEPPSEGGFWELGEWHETDMESPWRYAENRKMAPFDQQFFMILNLAVGGTEYFPDEATNPGGKPWSNDSPHAATGKVILHYYSKIHVCPSIRLSGPSR